MDNYITNDCPKNRAMATVKSKSVPSTSDSSMVTHLIHYIKEWFDL